MIKIYHVPLLGVSHWVRELRDELSWEERARADRFVFERDRESYVVCRGILRRILARELSCDPGAICFEYGPNGKPRLSALCGNRIEFNLSHTQGFALIAVTPSSRIGIDIEWERSIAISAMKDFLTEDEINRMQILSREDLPRAFLHYWTKKEAVLKGLGVGLTKSLPHCDFGQWDDKKSILFLPEQWTVLTLDYFDRKSSYVAALAYEGTNLPIAHCLLNPLALGLFELNSN